MNIPRDEAMRYLGGDPCNEATVRLVEDACLTAQREIIPASRVLPMACTVTADRVAYAGGAFVSRDLVRHMANCREMALVAATLGAKSELWMARARLEGLDRMAAMQAALTAMLEAYLDQLQNDLYARYAPAHLTPLSRFSPGYGDFALDAQDAFFDLMDLTARLGIRQTGAHMMLPVKTVTAVVGLSPENDREPRACANKCSDCNKTDCPYRRRLL